MLPVFIELVDVQQAFLEFSRLFTGYRSVHSGLNFFNRMLVAPVNKRGNVKLLTSDLSTDGYQAVELSWA